MAPRLTREQSQARTRERLLESASKALIRNGIDRTSIEQVAEGAGHTRGAFYGHFKGKEDLYLALLEDRFGRYIGDFDGALAGGDDPEVRARRAGDQFSSLIGANTEWQRLSFEFAAYAIRNERFRRELAKRYEGLRERVAEVFRRRADEYGVVSPIPYERLALMTYVMSAGIALQKLLEPERVSDDLYGEMLAIFFAGLRAGAPPSA